MSAKEWIILAVIIVAALIFLGKYGQAKYDDGFGVGCMAAFVWIESNTNCKDAIETYMLVSEQHPEDAIYIYERDPKDKTKYRLRQNASMFIIHKK